MSASQVAWSRRRVNGLPALIVLLLVLVAGGAGRLSAGPATAASEAALGAVPAATQPSAVPRADLRLLVKRGGHSIPGPVFASGAVPVLRVAPPAGWSTVDRSATAARHGVREEVYQGRAPPRAA